MSRICYTEKKFSDESLNTIKTANAIATDYARKGYGLTLRQLYYRFVAAGALANKDSEYKRLGSIINDARLAGVFDWHHLEDRTRNLRRIATYDSPGEIIDDTSLSYQEDYWKTQDYYVEVWVEKDALVGVIGQAANRFLVPYFSCRGYTSQSEVWRAAQRHLQKMEEGKECVIIHLGDHDPSGIDMTRDIHDRLQLFCEHDGKDAPMIERIALNMPQIKKYEPPPNPAKLTDSRYASYKREHGTKSWELDALPPEVLDKLVSSAIQKRIDSARWDQAARENKKGSNLLTQCSSRWDDVVEFLTA